MAPLMALNCAGRLSKSVAIPSASVRWISVSPAASNGAFTAANASLDGRRRLRPLAQHELLDLAGGGLRQLAENHLLRRLEAREMRPAVLDQLGLARRGSGLELHEGAWRL